jgi:hypothetical protein
MSACRSSIETGGSTVVVAVERPVDHAATLARRWR